MEYVQIPAILLLPVAYMKIKSQVKPQYTVMCIAHMITLQLLSVALKAAVVSLTFW